MWKSDERAPIWEFLGWTFLIVGVSEGFIILLEQFGIFTEAIRSAIYLVGDTLVGAFSPLYACFIFLKSHRKIKGCKEFLQLIIYTPNIKRVNVLLTVFGAMLLGVTAMCGKRTDFSWFILIPAVPLMVLGGGVEEVGWRGFLQPALEKKLPFVIATATVACIWALWHLPLWFIQASNQNEYNFLAFTLQIFVNSFFLAMLYKATKSVLACILWHAWGNAIGAVYEWSIFATFPVHKVLIIYYCVVLAASISIGVYLEHKEKVNLC